MAGYVQIAYLFREAPRLINIPRQYEPHLVAPFCLLWDKQNRWESALEVKLRRRGSGRRVTSPIRSHFGSVSPQAFVSHLFHSSSNLADQQCPAKCLQRVLCASIHVAIVANVTKEQQVVSGSFRLMPDSRRRRRKLSRPNESS